MSWTISLTFLQPPFDSMVIHLFSTCSCRSRRRKGSIYADKRRNATDCMFQVCLRQICDLHTDLYNWSRLNVNITIYSLCATSYFVAIVISDLSFTVYEIFTVETCIVRDLGLQNRSRSDINMPIESPYLTKSVVNHNFSPIHQRFAR